MGESTGKHRKPLVYRALTLLFFKHFLFLYGLLKVIPAQLLTTTSESIRGRKQTTLLLEWPGCFRSDDLLDLQLTLSTEVH